MTYSTFEFIAFLLALLVVYYAVPKKLQWCILLVASYAFYLLDGVKQVVFLVGTTLVTYAATMIMQRIRTKYKEELAARGEITREEKQQLKKQNTAKINRVKVIAIIIVLGALIVVKYTNLFIGGVNSIIGLFTEDGKLSTVKMLVPLGISFYSFQAMGYIIDVARGKYEPEKNPGKVALFLSFFPSIIQGPINRYDEVGVQLGEGHKLEYNNLAYGAQLMLWGFFKKLVMADRVAPIVATIFSPEYEQYGGSAFFVALVAFTIQLYGDFSGGIDIACGAAEMLGIKLPNNFERPYFAQSLSEFWRRWHITLGAWMKDYVFFPIMLSGWITKITKKVKAKFGNVIGKLIPSVITTFIVFFLLGMWHGATWQYVVYAIYNAVVVAGAVALDPVFTKINRKLGINEETFSWKLFRMVRTFLITCGSKVLVCAPSIGAAFKIFGKLFTEFDADFLFGVDGQIYELGVDRKNMIVLAIGLIIWLVVSILQERGVKIRETLAQQGIVFRWLVYFTAIIIVLVFGMYGPEFNTADFIYRQY